METPGTLAGGKPIAYGLGLALTSYRGLRTVGHNGSRAGFRSAMLRFPAERFTVICLCNTAGANPGKLARDVAEIYLAGKLSGPPPAAEPDEEAAPPPRAARVAIAAEQLRAFAGEYHSRELDATYRLAAGTGGLIVYRRRGVPPGLWLPAGKDSFRLGGATMVFRRNAQGRPAGFTIGMARAGGIVFARR
jgi:hypothetical protein